jgi:hypothetical protein
MKDHAAHYKTILAGGNRPGYIGLHVGPIPINTKSKK